MPSTLTTRSRSRSAASGGTAVPVDADEGTPPEAPSEDEVFDVLRASRRRAALRYLDAHGGEATIETLAEHVAAVENDVDPDAVAPQQRKRAYIALYQCHLPKMAKYGVIEYDRERGLARLRASARTVLAHLTRRPASHGSEAPGSHGPLATARRHVRRLLGR